MDGQLYGLLGAIAEHTADVDAIEVFSRRWMSWEPSRVAGLGIIETALLCESLKKTDRLDLACHVALCAVRGAWAAGAAVADEGATLAADAAGGLFQIYADQLWAECDDRLLSEFGLAAYSGFAAWVTYPIRCTRLAELVALYALRIRQDDAALARDIAAWIARFVTAQPGTARPMGDRYAVSVVPIAALLVADHREVLEQLVRSITIWVCDRYEQDEPGLASVDAPAIEEVSRVLGGPLEHIQLPPRKQSQIASVLLDLAATLDLGEVYADVRNDTLAVGLIPSVLLAADGPDQLSRIGRENRWDFNPDYADVIDGSLPAAPHLTSEEPPGIIPAERWWDLLAASAALRDRMFPAAAKSAASAAV